MDNYSIEKSINDATGEPIGFRRKVALARKRVNATERGNIWSIHMKINSQIKLRFVQNQTEVTTMDSI